MRVVLLAPAPWMGSGYAGQAAIVALGLRRLGHDVAVSCTSGLKGEVQSWRGVVLFPYGSPHVLNAQDIAGANAQHFRADVLVSICDAWTLSPELLADAAPWVPIVPIDTAECPPMLASKLAAAKRVIAISRHGESALAAAGVPSTYVPHAFDPAVFRPMPQSEARALLGWRPESFIASIVADNARGPTATDRKAFHEQIAGFAKFRGTHPDARLYLHARDGRGGLDGGTDLREVCRHVGLAESDVVIADQHSLMLGLPASYLAAVYNASDVLLSCTAGEGFCVPCVEAQATGCPVIVGEWSALQDRLGAGWMVPREDSVPIWMPLGGTWRLPSIPAIARALGEAYEARGSVQLRAAALEHAAEYAADNVIDRYWAPLLAELGADLSAIPTTGVESDAHAAE